MEKDPAILFYTKDWTTSTGELYLEEKGAFFELLCIQHQQGYIIYDPKRLAHRLRISLQDFDRIWNTIKVYFVPYTSLSDPTANSLNDPIGEKLANRRLFREINRRAVFKEKKAVYAIVGNWFRYDPIGKKLTKAKKEKLKRQIDYDFIFNHLFESQQIQEYLTTLAQGSDKRPLNTNGTGAVTVNETVTGNETGTDNSYEITIKGAQKKIEQKKSQKNAFVMEMHLDFFKKLCHFFSQYGQDRESKVWSFLGSLHKKKKLEEFKEQTRAYMDYKNKSQEKIHSWQGYQKGWEASDWGHKLRLLPQKQTPKRTFSTNH